MDAGWGPAASHSISASLPGGALIAACQPAVLSSCSLFDKQEEVAMQRAWAQDADKLTFILIDKALAEATAASEDLCCGMCGDVNLFLNDPDSRQTAEVEIMVAEAASRRKGIAREALQLFMAYARCHLDIEMFRAKIGATNQASLQLFASLGFCEVSFSRVFQEHTLELPLSQQMKGDMEQLAAAAHISTIA